MVGRVQGVLRNLARLPVCTDPVPELRPLMRRLTRLAPDSYIHHGLSQSFDLPL